MPTIPTRSTLELHARRERWIDFALIGSIVAIDVWLIGSFVADDNVGVLLLSLGLLVASSAIHLLWTLPFFRKSGREVKDLELATQIGRYSAGDIRRMVAELLEPHRGKELPAIYLTDAKYDGAYVLNSLFFNFLKPLNAVYISKYLFRILSPGEIRAILAHELGHFYRHMRPLGRARAALMVFNALLPVHFVDPTAPGAIRVILGLWIVFSVVFIRILNWHLGRHSRTHEFLCDLHAARRFGVLNMINALLGLAKTIELQFVIQARLLTEIRSDSTLSLQHLPQLFTRIDAGLADKPLSTTEIESAIMRALTAPETQRLRAPLSKSKEADEIRQIDRFIEAFLMNRTFDLLDWTCFDSRTPDGRVDAAEYPDLIRALESDAGKQLFATPMDNQVFVVGRSHPTTRERILFLERCRREASEPGTPALAL